MARIIYKLSFAFIIKFCFHYKRFQLLYVFSGLKTMFLRLSESINNHFFELEPSFN